MDQYSFSLFLSSYLQVLHEMGVGLFEGDVERMRLEEALYSGRFHLL